MLDDNQSWLALSSVVIRVPKSFAVVLRLGETFPSSTFALEKKLVAWMRQPERRLLLRELSSKFNDHKMITRRNWLLKCSIFANIVVLLYICSHVLVGNNTNINMSSSGSSSYLIQQFVPTNAQQQQKTSSIPTAQMVQEEQELVAILRNKQIELQKQIGMQDVIQVRPFDSAHA